MKYITLSLAFSFLLFASCQSNNNNVSDDQIPEMDSEELTRVSGLIDPAPSTYQEGQINQLIEYALAQNWPVQKTKSGLLYWISKEGNSKKPSEDSRFQVLYRGQLMNGSVFDQSSNREKPSAFKLNEMIPGWQESLQLIGEGGKMKILLHSNLGYGDRAIGNLIPSYSPLIFDIELIKIIEY